MRYIERVGDRWRWSLAHTGGSYPLLRISARFLRVDYHRIFIGARSIGGASVLCAEPNRPEPVDEWRMVDLPKRLDTAEAARAIVKAFELEPR